MHTIVNQQKELEEKGEVLKTLSTDHSTDSALGANCQQLIFTPETDKSNDLLTLVLTLVPSNVTYKMETSLVLTADSLRNLVESELGIDQATFLLLHKGQELKEESQPVANNSFVYIVPSSSPCDNELLTIRLQRGRTLQHILEFKASDKVCRITQTIANQFGVPAEHQTLLYCGGKLPNKPLKQLHIVNRSSIRLIVSPEYKKQMSKSYMFANPKPEEKTEQHLPQIEELAKDVQSIEDVDDEILKGCQGCQEPEQQEVVSADEDYFDNYPKRNKRTTYSTKQKSKKNQRSEERFPKSERPKVQELFQESSRLKLGLIEVKEVNSVYNPDEDDLVFDLVGHTGSAKGRNSEKVMEWDDIPEGTSELLSNIPILTEETNQC